MLHSLDAAMINPPLYRVDYGAGTRIQARTRAANRAQTDAMLATDKHVSDGLRAWKLMLEQASAHLPTTTETFAARDNFEVHLTEDLRAFQIALQRSTQFLNELQDVR